MEKQRKAVTKVKQELKTKQMCHRRASHPSRESSEDFRKKTINHQRRKESTLAFGDLSDPNVAVLAGPACVLFFTILEL